MKNYCQHRCTKTIFLLLSCTLLFLFSNAQWYDPEKVNKKAADVYAQAYEAANNEDYAKAISKINQAIVIEPRFVDAYLSRAGVYANLKKYDSSVLDFEKGMSLDSNYSENYFLPYSISLAGTGQFDKALVAVNRFLKTKTLNERSIKSGNYRKSVYEFAIDYERKHPSKNYVFAPHNLGDSVNSLFAEYYPSITIDGTRLIFTRRANGDEDFYESVLTNGKWNEATALGGKVNTNLNEGAQNISQDGEWIVFTGCSYPEGQGSCDVYISYKTKTGWTEAENLGPIVNSDFWESSPSLSPDKRDLYFSSSRQGSYGGSDIWVSHRSEKGKWSQPENLGPLVNTTGDEGCSFMYADNQTLFFNSNGHVGYGETDLFYTKKQTDGTWGEPINLGYPINTIDNEGSLIVASDGKTAYYASETSVGKGALDLYVFELREDIRPPKTLWVKGQVFDAKTKQGLPSSVELTDIKTRKLISKVQTDEDGNYLTTLPVGQEYAFNVNRKGYLFFSDNYNLSDTKIDSVFIANIPLQPIEVGAGVVLKNIFFDTKKTELKPESIVELDNVIRLMNDNPNLKILINGHTDNVGTQKDNLQLSNNRALSVVNYLLASKQIAKERLQYKGWGASKPIADNVTEEGRALNRRTELTVISNVPKP
jgi:outer membrane protein OmpA-like peptidoglycan-associated protein/tetratricopeptide (TPR) repeat protein